MQGCQQSRQGIGGLGTASRRCAVSRFTGDPGGDNPRAREPLGRLAETLRNRYLQREARRYGRQQGVLLEEQLVCVLSGPRQPDREVVAEPPQLVVPAASAKRHRQAGQVGVLFAEQLRNQIRSDLIFRARHRSNRRPSVENRPLARPTGMRPAHPGITVRTGGPYGPTTAPRMVAVMVCEPAAAGHSPRLRRRQEAVYSRWHGWSQVRRGRRLLHQRFRLGRRSGVRGPAEAVRTGRWLACPGRSVRARAHHPRAGAPGGRGNGHRHLRRLDQQGQGDRAPRAAWHPLHPRRRHHAGSPRRRRVRRGGLQLRPDRAHPNAGFRA